MQHAGGGEGSAFHIQVTDPWAFDFRAALGLKEWGRLVPLLFLRSLMGTSRPHSGGLRPDQDYPAAPETGARRYSVPEYHCAQ